MNYCSIDAAIELYSMYKSGVLGTNLIPVADDLHLDILSICYSKLKEATLLPNQDTSSILSLLNNISLVLKTNIFSSTINESIEKLINHTHNINTEILTDIASDLELLRLELSSNTIECATSNAHDIGLLGL